MANTVGQATVVCPVCGDLLQTDVELQWVKVWGTSLQVGLRDLTISHECPGGVLP